MGKIWMPGGGGGADLDVITVSDPSDVLAGKVIVDKNGNPLTGTLALSGNVSDAQVLYGQTYYNSDPKIKRTGTMPNRGAVSQSLGINGTYTIPAGYHNGSGKVTQNITTMAGQTITPNASQQTVSSSGKYMSGNVVVNAVSNLSAGNIKKGVVVGGITGTFEGYVPTATDLYLRGNNIKGFTVVSGTCAFDAGQITVLSNGTQVIAATFSTVGYTHLNVQGYTNNANEKTWELRYKEDSMYYTIASLKPTFSGDYTISLDVTNQQMQKYFYIFFGQSVGAIYRIWLS